MIRILIFGCIWFIGFICYLIVFSVVFSKMLKAKQKRSQAWNNLCQSFESFNKSLKKHNKKMDEILIKRRKEREEMNLHLYHANNIINEMWGK